MLTAADSADRDRARHDIQRRQRRWRRPTCTPHLLLGRATSLLGDPCCPLLWHRHPSLHAQTRIGLLGELERQEVPGVLRVDRLVPLVKGEVR